MVDVDTDRTGNIDLSFIASLECDLSCAHCMYLSNPSNKTRLDYENTRQWLETVDWEEIHACGFYGGEPSILLDWYWNFVKLVPPEIPKFVITNGTWSTDKKRTREFKEFCLINKMKVIVSGTIWHRSHQDRTILEQMSFEYGFILKGDESKLIAMGRAKSWLPDTCTKLCLRWNKPYRIALHPNNNIIFQSCDGEYPILQTLDEPFKNIIPNIKKLLLSKSSEAFM